MPRDHQTLVLDPLDAGVDRPDVHPGAVAANEDPERGQVVLLDLARVRLLSWPVNLEYRQS